ncbi:MAG: RHS repeat-associated core domain-containing protein, partial [Planctomycetes bacterium]|nr:RHS repeat-associated core domain-containing protein [Planctomycetota bacterium]
QTRVLHRTHDNQPIAGGEVVTSYEHDAGGHVTRIVPDTGAATVFTRDPAGRLTEIASGDAAPERTIQTLDAAGNVTRSERRVRNAATGQDDIQVADSVYDAYDRVISNTVDPNGANLTTSMKYDSRGNVVEVTDPQGNRVQRSFDGLGNVRTWTSTPAAGGGAAITLTFDFDSDGNLASVVDGMGRTTSYTRDVFGRPTQIHYADATQESFEYDDAGNVALFTDRNGTVVQTAYTGFGAPAFRSVTEAQGVEGHADQAFTYDGIHRLIAVETNMIRSESYAYTSLDQAESVQFNPADAPVGPFTLSFQFDAQGNRSRMVYPIGRTLALETDEHSRRSRILEGGSELARYDYAGAAVARRIYSNGLTLTATRDDRGQVTSWTHADGAGMRAGFGYAYDTLGRRSYRARLHDGMGDAYRYDGHGQLTGVKEGVPVTNLAPGQSYANYLTFTAQRQYEFDAAGNRKTVDTDGALSFYNYVNGIYAPDLVNRVATVDSVTRTHDANGNVLDDGTNTYTYSYRNQLMRAWRKSDNALIAHYEYDALGRRVRRYDIVAGEEQGWVEYYHDGARIIAEQGSDGAYRATCVNGIGIDEVLSMDRVQPGGGTARYFLHEDALGSVCLVTDAAGANVERYDYSEYGMPTVSAWDPAANGGAGGWLAGVVGGASAIGNTRMFTGREWDAEIGLYYYRARHYDPGTGRFASRDPIGAAGDSSRNDYRYVNNSPALGVDPLGLYEEDVHRGLTTYLAMIAGLSSAEASNIGDANFGVDTAAETNPVTVGVRRAICNKCGDTEGAAKAQACLDEWHFPKDEGKVSVVRNSAAANQKVNAAIAAASGWAAMSATARAILIADLGKGLHVLQDSYSHEEYGDDHIFGGHHPDHTCHGQRRPRAVKEDFYTKEEQMVRRTLEVLLAFRSARGDVNLPTLKQVYAPIDFDIDGFLLAHSKDQKERYLRKWGLERYKLSSDVTVDDCQQK